MSQLGKQPIGGAFDNLVPPPVIPQDSLYLQDANGQNYAIHAGERGEFNGTDNVSYFVASAPAVSVPAPAALDSSTDNDHDSVLTIKKRVDEVNVLFIATDRHGKFVRNLNQRDFTILDDHKPPQAIVNFRRETDLPLEVGLLVDTSGSVQDRFSFEKHAATRFLQQLLTNPSDLAFVAGFSVLGST